MVLDSLSFSPVVSNFPALISSSVADATFDSMDNVPYVQTPGWLMAPFRSVFARPLFRVMFPFDLVALVRNG